MSSSESDIAKLWQQVSISELQEELTTTLINIKAFEDKSLQSRAGIAEETKQVNKKYKKIKNAESVDVSEVVQEYKSLVKHYQQGIDELTQRCKFGDDFVAKMATRLSELPDPSPIFAKLSLPNQMISDESKEGTGFAGISLADYELVSNELENCQRRIMDLEIQLERKRDAASGSHEISLSSSEENNKHLANLEKENSILLGRLEDTQKQTVKHTEKITNLEMKNNELVKINESMAAELDLKKDYDYIKNELETLQKNEYGVVISNPDLSNDNALEYTNRDAVQDTDPSLKERKSNFVPSSDDVEASNALIETNKRLQSKLAELRGSMEDLKDEKSKISSQLENYVQEVARLKEENHKLEEDLENLDDVSSKFTDTQSIISSVHQPRGGVLSSSANIFTSSMVSGQGAESGFDNSASNGMLQIIKQQRDRFRNKNVELEKQLKTQSIKIEQLNREKTDLHKYAQTHASNGTNNKTIKDRDLESGNRYRGQSYYEDYENNTFFEKMFNLINRYISQSKNSRMVYILYVFFIHLVVFLLLIAGKQSSTTVAPVTPSSTSVRPANI